MLSVLDQMGYLWYANLAGFCGTFIILLDFAILRLLGESEHALTPDRVVLVVMMAAGIPRRHSDSR